MRASGDIHTRRIEVDPSRAKRMVADAAYQRFLEATKKKQLAEAVSQQQVQLLTSCGFKLLEFSSDACFSRCLQYDLEVMQFDKDLLETMIKTQLTKDSLKESLDRQVAELSTRRKQREFLPMCGCCSLVQQH